jgi:hypothetical protein
MPKYTFWFSETYTNKGWFDAESKEQAKDLLNKLELGEITFDDLEGWGYKDKGYDLDIDTVSIEEII